MLLGIIKHILTEYSGNSKFSVPIDKNKLQGSIMKLQGSITKLQGSIIKIQGSMCKEITIDRQR
jgi:hypothetical protein